VAGRSASGADEREDVGVVVDHQKTCHIRVLPSR
jgi:hypothetical protein